MLLLAAAYFVITAIAGIGIDTIVEELKKAETSWLLAGLVTVPLVPVAQSFGTIGASILPLRLGPVIALEYAIQFIALAVPSSAARVAVNVRFFQRRGGADDPGGPHHRVARQPLRLRRPGDLITVILDLRRGQPEPAERSGLVGRVIGFLRLADAAASRAHSWWWLSLIAAPGAEDPRGAAWDSWKVLREKASDARDALSRAPPTRRSCVPVARRQPGRTGDARRSSSACASRRSGTPHRSPR